MGCMIAYSMEHCFKFKGMLLVAQNLRNPYTFNLFLYFRIPFIFATKIFITCKTSLTNSSSGSLSLDFSTTTILPCEYLSSKSSNRSYPKRAEGGGLWCVSIAVYPLCSLFDNRKFKLLNAVDLVRRSPPSEELDKRLERVDGAGCVEEDG